MTQSAPSASGRQMAGPASVLSAKSCVAVAVRQLGQRRQIGHSQQRIADRFHDQQFGARLRARLPTAARSQVSTSVLAMPSRAASPVNKL